jgi:hypothetical protein
VRHPKEVVQDRAVTITADRTLERSAFELEFEDDFDSPVLDGTRWISHYLPHWSVPTRTAARYEVGGGRLRLRIEADQLPWCPPLDGDLRVSSLQTAVFAGPLGSRVGQHHFRDTAVVETEQTNRASYLPENALVELRMRALRDPRCMVALWMIGLGDAPERSGEICVAEIFGRDIDGDAVRVGMGIHPFEDPALVDDFVTVELAIDATDFHVYSADWTPERVAWYADDRLVRVVGQAPAYPLALMLGVYEFAVENDERSERDYPKVFEVDWVRGYRRTPTRRP